MTLTSPPEISLRYFEVRFSCGGQPGIRNVWAPSERSASRVLREHPSSWGLAHEAVLVTHVRELQWRTAGKRAAA
jgi:hypothetical protein